MERLIYPQQGKVGGADKETRTCLRCALFPLTAASEAQFKQTSRKKDTPENKDVFAVKIK